MASYQGFWGLQTGDALAELAEFLSWNKDDWVNFEQWLDILEAKTRKKKQKRSRRALRQRLHQLRYRGAVESQKIGDEVLVRLTAPGWRHAWLQKIRAISTPCANGLCIIAFDIPESRHATRDAFRRFLKSAGCEQLQRSVWVHRLAVTEAICAVVKELGIMPWVTVAEGPIKSAMFD